MRERKWIEGTIKVAECRRCRGYGQIPVGLDGDDRGECPGCKGSGYDPKSR